MLFVVFRGRECKLTWIKQDENFVVCENTRRVEKQMAIRTGRGYVHLVRT